MPDLAQSPVTIVRLPWGYIDPEGVLHQEVQIEEMGGEAEDLLAARGINPLKKLTAIIANSVKRVGTITAPKGIADAVRGMASVDRMVLLIEERILTAGDRFKMTVTCPSCKRSAEDLVVSLREILGEMKPPDDPAKRLFSETLPSGKSVVWTPLTYEAEQALAYLSEDESQADERVNLQRRTITLWARVVELDGRKFSRKFEIGPNGRPTIPKDELEAVAALKLRDRMHLSNRREAVEDILPMELDFKCEFARCGFSGKLDLDIMQPSFFYPSEI